MAGTKEGGKKAAKTTQVRYGADFHKSIGSIGGKRGNTGGFASKKVGKDGLTGPERAQLAGLIGGKHSIYDGSISQELRQKIIDKHTNPSLLTRLRRGWGL